MSALGKRWAKPTLLFIVFLLFLAIPRLALALLGSSYFVELLVQSMIYGILALSLNLLLGYMGFPSLGHGAYLGIAAYTTAICIIKFHMGALPASTLAILLTTFAAALFGLFALRARGVYFLMITLALAMVIWGLAYRWVSLTAGDNGISGISRPQIGPWSLREITSYYYFVFAIFLICLFIIYRIVRSPFGRSLVGIKESETRMRTLGYNVWLHQYICFVMAGFFGGVSGVLFIFYNGFISPPSLEVTPNMEVLLMVALGGPGTVIGPFIGAMVIVFLKNFVSVYTERWLIFLGSIYIFTILYAPKGLLETVDIARKFLMGKSTSEKKPEKEYGK
jgi:branched-chain amino acid transport system permease protein